MSSPSTQVRLSGRMLPVLFLLASQGMVAAKADTATNVSHQNTPTAVQVTAGNPEGSSKPFDPRNYGARGDGVTPDTIAIQKAIDQAVLSGGGTVVLAGGRFLSGTLELKDHVTLRVEKGAVLLGSSSRDHYNRSLGRFALLVAKNREGITLCGEGIVDGQGSSLAENILRMAKAGKFPDTLHANRADESNRPMLIWFDHCRNVKVTDVTLKDSSCWVQTYNGCDGLLLDHVKVDSVAYWNNDGIDLVDSRHVRVTGCDINSADDGICLKSGRCDAACEDVLVEKCRVRSSASALKFGTGSVGGFRHVKVRDLEVRDTFRSAVALEAVDGAMIEDVDISGITAKNTGNAVFIRLGHRRGAIGSIRNVVISDMTVEVPEGRPDAGYKFPGPSVRKPHNLFPSSIIGLPGHPVRGVTLRNISITFGGGGRRDRAQVPLKSLSKIPEQENAYPEFSMFGELPAWGFYCRHAEGITFQNVTMALRHGDYRSALVADNVKGLTLDAFRVLSAGEEPVIVLKDVTDFRISDSPPPAGAREMVRKID